MRTTDRPSVCSGGGAGDLTKGVRVGPYLAAMALSLEARHQFLAEPHVAALSVVAGPDEGPLTVPIWYQYPPGGELWILTPAASRKTDLIRAAGRFTMLVDRVAPSVRYVSVQGPVTRIVPGTRRDLEELARRYLPSDQVTGFMAMAEAEHGEQVTIHMRPERWLSADLG